MKQKVILVGGFHEVVELCENCDLEIVGIIDGQLSGDYYGYPIIGSDEDAESLLSKYKDCYLVITPDSPQVRNKLATYYGKIGYKFATIISPEARVSKTASIGEGAVVQAGVHISSEVKVGKFVKLNTNCNVMHDNTIGDYTTIAPNAVLLGKVFISEKAYIGANSTILPNIIIENSSMIGAGSVVTRDVKEGTIVKGVPAK